MTCQLGLTATLAILLLLPMGHALKQKCPTGSFPSPTDTKQCVSCRAGQRCCTVNWNSSCPKCDASTPQSDVPFSYHSSIFAFQSADPPSCLASPHAVCTPKFEIGINSECKIFISSINYARQTNFRRRMIDRTVPFCPWSSEAFVGGAALGPILDLAKLSFTTLDIRSPNTSLLEATAITPLRSTPLLKFRLPAPNCTLTYRALTSPAAAFLLIPPKPCPPGTPNCPRPPPGVAAACPQGSSSCSTAAAATCPPGHYLETATDASPPPCLPCPPGSYAPAPSSASACSPCLEATHAPAFGSTACSKCPAGNTSNGGAVTCIPCTKIGAPDPDDPCSTCPALTTLVRDFCISNEYGTSCCAMGNCTGQAPCKHKSLVALVLESSVDQFGAALQLATAGSAKACKGDRLLAKLQPDARLLLSTSLTAPSAITMTSLTPKPVWYMGILTSTTQATIGDAKASYILRSHAATRTVTVRSKSKPACSATFKLTAGYVFDLRPPKGATCPAGTSTVTAGGRSFCKAP